MTKRILGYSDEISVAPGGRIRFMVSCEPGIDRYRAEIVRMRSGDIQPGGPGLREYALEPPAVSEHPGREQAIHPGSFACVPDSPALATLTGFTLHALVMPTIAGQGVQALLTKWSLSDEAGFGLFLDADGCLLVGCFSGCQEKPQVSLNALINIMLSTLFLSRRYAAPQRKSRKPKSRKIHDTSRKNALRAPVRHLRQNRQRPRPVRGRARIRGFRAFRDSSQSHLTY